MKSYRQLAMGLLALTLCVALPSCSNDDENNEEQSETELQGMMELLNLKMNLCMTDVDGNPVEAAFGEAYSEANPSERVYYTKDVTTARKRFKSLFNSTTQCSADGNTYTLADKQGTASFAEADGNKGLLGTATFDVPGLKGLVTKIYFIDYTQKGENANKQGFDNLTPGCIAQAVGNYALLAVAPMKDPDDDIDIYLMFKPYVSANGIGNPAFPLMHSCEISIAEAFEKLTEEEYSQLYIGLMKYLSNKKYTNPDQYPLLDGRVIDSYEYQHWDRKSFYLYAEDWSMPSFLLLNPDNYANRAKKYKMKDNVLPEELSHALPLTVRPKIATRYHEILIHE